MSTILDTNIAVPNKERKEFMINSDNAPWYEIIAIFIVALIGRCVLNIKNRTLLSLLISCLVHLLNFALFWYFEKKDEKKEKVENTTTTSIQPSPEWKKKSRKFLILESISWAILIVNRLIQDCLTNEYVGVSDGLEVGIMMFCMIHWFGLYATSDKYTDEMDGKEILLYFHTMPINYVSWWSVWAINTFITIFLRQ